MASQLSYKYGITFTQEFQNQIAEAWLSGDALPNLDITYSIQGTSTLVRAVFSHKENYPAWTAGVSGVKLYCNAEGENAVLELPTLVPSVQVKIESVSVEYTDDFASAIIAVINDLA